MDHSIHQSPLNSDFANSFTKIGDEIDDIFNQIDQFGLENRMSSVQSSTPLKCDKLTLSEIRSNPYKGNKNEQFFEISQATSNPFSQHCSRERDHSAIISDVSGARHVNRNSIGSSMSTLKSQTFVGSENNSIFRAPLSFTSMLSTDHNNLNQSKINMNCISVRGGEEERRRVQENQISKERLDKEKLMCKKNKEEVAVLKSRLSELSNKVELITTERNKIVFKLEAAVREIDNQDSTKQDLTKKVLELNNKLLENDYENSQLQSQMNELTRQLETSEDTHTRLMDQLDKCYLQIKTSGEERQKLIELCERKCAEYSNSNEKCDLIQRLHQSCGIKLKELQDEKDLVMNKVHDLSSSLSNSEEEKKTMLDNLTKVYKLVEKLETKAAQKIEILSAEVNNLQNVNVVLKDQIIEKDAIITNNKNVLDEHQAKQRDFDIYKAHSEENSQRLEKQNLEIVTQKSKRIKQLTIKLKEVIKSCEDKENNLKDLYGLNEILQEQVTKLETETQRSSHDRTTNTHAIATLQEQLRAAEKSSNTSNNAIKCLEKALEENGVKILSLEKKLGESEKMRNDETSQLASELKLTKMKLATCEKRCVDLVAVIQQNEIEGEKTAHSVQTKQTCQDKKVTKLKDKLYKMILEKQEVETQLQECQCNLEAVHCQLNTTETNYTTYTDTIQHDMMEKVREQQNLLEKYRHEYEKEKFHLDTQLQDLTSNLGEKTEECRVLEGELVSASDVAKLLRTQNNSLLNAVEKYRQKHSKLKSSFVAKLEEMSNEQRCELEELIEYHGTAMSRLKDKILACYDVIGNEGENEDDLERYLDVIRETLRKSVRDKEEMKKKSEKISMLKDELNKAVSKHDTLLYQKHVQTDEIAAMQQKFERSIASYELEISFDKNVMKEFEKIKDEQKAQAELEEKYLKAHDQSTHLEAQLKAAKHAVREYRASNEETAALAVSLRLRERELCQSKEKNRQNKKRSLSLEY